MKIVTWYGSRNREPWVPFGLHENRHGGTLSKLDEERPSLKTLVGVAIRSRTTVYALIFRQRRG